MFVGFILISLKFIFQEKHLQSLTWKRTRKEEASTSIVALLTVHFTWRMLSYSHIVQMFQLKVHSQQVKHDKLIIPTHGISGSTGYSPPTCTELQNSTENPASQTKRKTFDNSKRKYIYNIHTCNILMCTQAIRQLLVFITAMFLDWCWSFKSKIHMLCMVGVIQLHFTTIRKLRKIKAHQMSNNTVIELRWARVQTFI